MKALQEIINQEKVRNVILKREPMLIQSKYNLKNNFKGDMDLYLKMEIQVFLKVE